jgi:hypothetical protein
MSTPSSTPAPEETAAWQKRLASQANNRAWALSEAAARTADEDEEMLQAAHAAMYFWRIVGNAHNRAHAAQLVAHVYALLKLPIPARHYLNKSQPYFLAQPLEQSLEQACAPWEVALAHAIAAHVAAAAGEAQAHARHFKQAESLVSALQDPQDREILEATLRVIPRPGSASAE